MSRVEREVVTGAVAQRSGALDGLRGFAALAVITCHVTSHLPVWPYPTGGNIGVLVFFVLSGYLIGGQCWDAPARWSSYRTFVRRRVSRLAPAVLGLVLIGGTALVLLGRQPLGEAATNAAFALTQTMAFAWSRGLSESPAWSPTWSLTVEWTFYLLVPLALLAARRAGVAIGRARTAAFVLAALLYGIGLLLPPVAFYLLPVANLGVMCAGLGLALTHRMAVATRHDPAWSTFGAALLVALVVLPGTTLGASYRFMILPVAVVASLLLVNAARVDSPVARLLTRGGLPAVGLRAYSLYLWHMPVLWLLWVNLRAYPVGLTVLAYALTLPLVTEVSFRLLERPWLARRPPREGSASPEARGDGSTSDRSVSVA